jgi:hypothetical protein
MEYHKIFSLRNIYYFCEFDLVWKTEEWKDVIDYEGIYQISDLGRVKSLNYNRSNKTRILTACDNLDGYLQVHLSKFGIQKSAKVHQLVAIAFLNHIPCGLDLVINHKNFIRTDNRKLNLEITTFRNNTNRKHLPSISDYTGVILNKKTKKWVSRVSIKGKYVYIGAFDTEIEASEYYENALISIKNGTEIKTKKHIPSSVHKGISWCNTFGVWIAQATIKGKRVKSGNHKSEEEAILALEKLKTN